MKTFNLTATASLLKENGFTRKNPLSIEPTVFHAWLDTRHFSEETVSETFVSLWQERGCVYGRINNETIRKIQKTESYDPAYNYWDSECPYESELQNAIYKAMRTRRRIFVQRRLKEIYDFIGEQAGMNIPYTESMNGSLFPSIPAIGEGSAEKENFDDIRFLAENDFIIPKQFATASDDEIARYIIDNEMDLLDEILSQAELDYNSYI